MQKEVEKIIVGKKEEVNRLKENSEKSLTQIKKLKKDMKSLEKKVQQFIEKETTKPSNVEIQVQVQEINTDPINFTA